MTTADLLGIGVGGTALDWSGYALAISTLGGLLLGQLAFASGALPPAVAVISVTNPIASVAVGLLAFDAPIPSSPAALASIAVSAALIAVGITGLANAPSTQQMYMGNLDGGTRRGASDDKAGARRASDNEAGARRASDNEAGARRASDKVANDASGIRYKN